MILIKRGDEPPELATLRQKKLASLRALGRTFKSDDFDGYKGKDNGFAALLSRAQHKKCCYCEGRLTTSFNDVEHYRPKCRADRAPGSDLTHGYWWLAFTWNNLMFACASCNRTGKNDQFPLAHDAMPLMPEQSAPGDENPLLLDPCSSINPVEHIVFALELGQWVAKARNNSVQGEATIKVCKLNSQDLLENRKYHIENVILPQVKALNSALAARQTDTISAAFDRALGMLTPTNEYVALAYDAFRHFIPDAKLQASIKKGWPAPSQVGR